MLRSYTKLKNGLKMPMIGFGTALIEDGPPTVIAVKTALEAGYRHIDTATAYYNEENVGLGLRESGIPREDIFLVGKVWNTDQGYSTTLAAFELSLKKLGCDYFDLYLIHWPKEAGRTAETWRAMENLYAEGRTKAIGVCNFKIHHLETLAKTARETPMVVQVEVHPQNNQQELMDYCETRGAKLEAWGPLAQGKVFQNVQLKALAEQYGVSVAQLVLRWHYQRGVITIPKSTLPKRIRLNAEIDSFALTDEDMRRISALNTGERIGPDPDTIDF